LSCTEDEEKIVQTYSFVENMQVPRAIHFAYCIFICSRRNRFVWASLHVLTRSIARRSIYSAILRKDWCVHKGGARNIKTLRLVHDWPWSWRGVRYPGLVRSQPGFSQRRRSVAYASLMPVPDVDCYYLLPIARNASIKCVKLDLCDIN